MDTSEPYIKMADCSEIQGQHHGSDPIGFLVWKQGSRKLVCRKCEEYVDSDFCPNCGLASEFEEGAWNFYQFNAIGPFLEGTWLPRQDQLQEMSGLTWRDFDILSWACAWDDGKATTIPSKEQAGIMALMLHKHSKTWAGTEWKEDEHHGEAR